MQYVAKPAESLQSSPVRSSGLTEPATVRALVVEDERKVADALRRGLQNEAFDVTLAHTVEGALREVADEAFDVILLDLMLPDGDGFVLLSTLRSRHVETPVLVLTARDAVEDRIAG